MSTSPPTAGALDRARAKAYVRLLPLLFLCYAIAYVDRINVSLASLRMTEDLPGFDNAVIGFGAGIFFWGYLLLEIPGTLLVERWSARKWFCRIMVSWGFVAALTAFVKTPMQFYGVRFLLGVAEAGFFPGVIVYLTHWFPQRDRARALSWFFIATPVAQAVSPKLSYYLLRIGTTEAIGDVTATHPELLGGGFLAVVGRQLQFSDVWVTHPEVLGLQGWQWLYIGWGIPAVVLGVLVLSLLPDWPRQARWLDPDESDALERELAREKEEHKQGHRHMTVLEALRHPKVLWLAAAYFFVVSTSYGVEFFLPKILEQWYTLDLRAVTWAVVIPPLGGLFGQLFVGWSSDRTGERRLHGSVPIYLGAAALTVALVIPSSLSFNVRLAIAVGLFTVALAGLKGYMPAFWALPSLILTESAAAGSVGLINMLGNLGGSVGPTVLGELETRTHSFVPGLAYLCVSMTVSATIILTLGLGHRQAVKAPAHAEPLIDEEADQLVEPA
jgi:ACS family tartrate transporter-like MFS transporter